MTTEDITELVIAVSGLIAAITALIRAFQDVHARLDSHEQQIVHLSEAVLGVPPRGAPEISDNSP